MSFLNNFLEIAKIDQIGHDMMSYVPNMHYAGTYMTRRAEILLASKSNYGGRALGLGMKWLKFEFSDK